VTGDPGPAAAVLPLDGRVPLSFEPLHGRPLYLTAVAHLAEVLTGAVVRTEADRVTHVAAEVADVAPGVRVQSIDEWWRSYAARPPLPLLVHDPLCPLAPPDFLSGFLDRAGEGTSLAAYRPVTDTVKVSEEGTIAGTLDRRGLVALTSPVLVSAPVMAAAVAAEDPPPLNDVGRLVSWLRRRGPVELVHAPAIARRVDDVGAVHLLEAVDELGRQLRLERRPPSVSGG
jgi:2-C-methyl-D-erythritol 4-phosphate cytidylyltransferase